MTLWKVQPGKYGEREQFATEENQAVIGWEEVPDLSKLKTRDELTDLLSDTYPEKQRNTLNNWESSLWAFSKRMEVGDIIAMPLRHRAIIKFGYVVGDYKYVPTNPTGFKHTRPVNWKFEIPRNKIDQDLLYSFGSAMTVCKISRNNADNRIKALLNGKLTTPIPPVLGADDETEESLDLEQFARDQITATITQTFKGHKLAHLTAAVLQAQGYKLRVSPEGPDGGVDIIAGKGPLGYESPRLVVQVKSSDSPVNVKVFRELNGVMDTFGAESGLIVSWGGYQSQVEKEAARHFFKIRLWDADDLVQMIEENYDALPEDIQSELPLKRIWILMPEEEE